MLEQPSGRLPIFQFFGADASLNNVGFPGAAPLVEAGVALAQESVVSSSPYSVLVWGWPGTGKTLYPQHLYHRLRGTASPFSLLHIHGGKIPCATEEEAMSALNEVSAIAASADLYPMIIAFDEAQLLGPVGGSLEAFYNWLTSYLDSDSPGSGAVVFVITSEPELLDADLASQLGFQVFVPLPSFDAAVELLGAVGVPNAEAVTTRLWGLSEELGINFSGRSLIHGARYAKAIARAKDSVETDTLVNAVLASSAPVPKHDFDKYLTEHFSSLRDSRDFLELWGGRYARSHPERVVEL